MVMVAQRQRLTPKDNVNERDEQQIATTILKQLQYGSTEAINLNGKFHKLNYLKIIGAQTPYLSLPRDDKEGVRGGVQLRIRDKLKVIIKLNFLDLYDVEVWKVNITVDEYECRQIASENKVYCDQLTEFVNALIAIADIQEGRI